MHWTTIFNWPAVNVLVAEYGVVSAPPANIPPAPPITAEVSSFKNTLKLSSAPPVIVYVSVAGISTKYVTDWSSRGKVQTSGLTHTAYLFPSSDQYPVVLLTWGSGSNLVIVNCAL